MKINELSQDILSLDIDLKFFSDYDISESVFVGDPLNNFNLVLSDYNFKDVSTRQLNKLRYCFADSKILSGDFITKDVFIMMPKIK